MLFFTAEINKYSSLNEQTGVSKEKVEYKK